jgi:GNAT superfamily N-acetyltransferase
VSTGALPDPDDLEPGDEKARLAREQFTIRPVSDRTSSEFFEGYGALWDEFGPRGELERRAVVEGWLERGAQGVLGEDRRLDWHYHLLVARDAHGQLAGVRDCHVTVDADRRECIVYLAHTLVLPAYRRGGLASLFRAAPLTLARRASSGLPDCDILMAAEMEPLDRSLPDSLVRLIAYGRGGFRVVPPAALPYCQPDFRDLAQSGDAARPLPLLAVVRWVNHPSSGEIPKRLAEAYARHLYAVFATHCRPSDLSPPLAHMLAALARADDPIALLSLPANGQDDAALSPLASSEVLRHFR